MSVEVEVIDDLEGCEEMAVIAALVHAAGGQIILHESELADLVQHYNLILEYRGESEVQLTVVAK